MHQVHTSKGRRHKAQCRPIPEITAPEASQAPLCGRGFPEVTAPEASQGLLFGLGAHYFRNSPNHQLLRTQKYVAIVGHQALEKVLGCEVQASVGRVSQIFLGMSWVSLGHPSLTIQGIFMSDTQDKN
jgi:hypothetical protein